MRTKLAQILAVGLLASTPAAAGVYFTAVTTVEAGEGSAVRRIAVRGWADGDRLKVELDESDDAVLLAGRSLVTYDGGATVYLVDPKEKTFTQVDLGKLLALQGGGPAEGARRGAFEVTHSNPDVLTLADEEGPPIAGLSTRHLRFRTSFTTEKRSMGLRQNESTVIEDDLWVATELEQPALAVWFGRGPESTGDRELDGTLAGLRQAFTGVPVKRVGVVTTTERRGGVTVVRSTTELLELRVEDIEPARFNMGSGYREKPLVPAPGQPGEQRQAEREAEQGQEYEQYPFDQMLDPDEGKPVQHPQPGAQPGTQPGVQPGTPPAQPVEPQEPQEDPEYPFERMLDAPNG